MKINTLDKKILFALDENARASHSQIAKTLRVDRTVVAYRIKRLEEEGVLRGSFTEVNNAALGFSGFRVFLALATQDPTLKESFLSYLKKEPRVGWLFSSTGRWDVDMVLWCKNRFEFLRILENMKDTYNSIIREIDVATIVDILHYPKTYLVSDQRKNPRAKLFGESVATISENAAKVLGCIAHDARKSVIDICSSTGLSVNTVKRHMKELVDQKIVLGFRPFINIESLGYQYCRLHLELHQYTKADRMAIMEWFANDVCVVYVDLYLSSRSDLEVEYHIDNIDGLHKKIRTFFEKFGRYVKRYEVLTFEKEYVARYLPQDWQMVSEKA